MVDVSDIVGFDALEDRLTALFIATLEHSPTDNVLKPFLKAVNFDLNFKKDLEEVKFGLQIHEASSIPDAQIEGRSFLIYIEVKRGDSVDSSQVERHFEGGKGKKPKFCVLCITSGLYKPEGIKNAERKLKERGETPDIRWMNWKKVYELMKDSEKRVKDGKSRFLIKSLNSALEKHGLVGFTGFDEDEFMKAKEFIEKYETLLKKCNQLMYEVAEELKKHSIKQVYFNRDGRSTNKLDLITQALYYFNKQSWEPTSMQSWEKGSTVLVAFLFHSGMLAIGPVVLRQTLYKENLDWQGFLKSINVNLLKIRYKIRGEGLTRAESTKEFLDKLEETREDKSLERVDFPLFVNYEEEELRKPQLVETIVKYIDKSLELLQQFSLFEPKGSLKPH